MVAALSGAYPGAGDNLHPRADLIMLPTTDEGVGDGLPAVFFLRVSCVVDRYPGRVRDIEAGGSWFPVMDGFVKRINRGNRA